MIWGINADYIILILIFMYHISWLYPSENLTSGFSAIANAPFRKAYKRKELAWTADARGVCWTDAVCLVIIEHLELNDYY